MPPKGAARGIVGAGVDSQMRGSTLAHPRKRQHNERKRQIMNNHTITIKRDSTPAQDYQAECSCGWVSNRSWLEATARRVAHNHMAAVIQPTA
jgi:hypothetical protein